MPQIPLFLKQELLQKVKFRELKREVLQKTKSRELKQLKCANCQDSSEPEYYRLIYWTNYSFCGGWCQFDLESQIRSSCARSLAIRPTVKHRK